MRKSIVWLLFAGLILSQLPAQTERAYGVVDYVEGSVTVTRSGKQLGDLNFGDGLMVNDQIRTGRDGMVVIALDRSTGMSGTLTVKASTSLYLRLQTQDSGAAKSNLEVLAGQVGAKVTRMTSGSTLEITTESVVMGVRGTEFGFVVSPSGNTLIYCTEGAVQAMDSGGAVSIPAGKAAERKIGEMFRLLPVAVSSPADFEKRWMAEDIEVFKANALPVLNRYANEYRRLYDEFNRLFEPFQSDEILTKWLREDAEGVVPRATNPAVMREKRAMASHLAALRKNLFIFERIYFRLDQLVETVSGTAQERARLEIGQTTGEFLRRVRNDAPMLSRRVSLVRYAEVLYAVRNDGQFPMNFDF